MSNTILENNSLTLSYQNIPWCAITVEHPFDQKVSSPHINNDWVNLVESDPDCLDQQGLLLCPYSEVEWVIWLPSHGEKVIHINQLCRLPLQ
jgi:hypothetical protein